MSEAGDKTEGARRGEPKQEHLEMASKFFNLSREGKSKGNIPNQLYARTQRVQGVSTEVEKGKKNHRDPRDYVPNFDERYAEKIQNEDDFYRYYLALLMIRVKKQNYKELSITMQDIDDAVKSYREVGWGKKECLRGILKIYKDYKQPETRTSWNKTGRS